MKSLVNKKIYLLITNPFFYVFSLAVPIFVNLNYFVFGNFFNGSTTDLHRFFMGFPLAFMIYLPLTAALIQQKTVLDLPFEDFFIPFAIVFPVFASGTLMVVLSIPSVLSAGFFGDLDLVQLFMGLSGIFLFLAASCIFVTWIFMTVKNAGGAMTVSIILLGFVFWCHNIPVYFASGFLAGRLIQTFSFAWHFDTWAKGIFSIGDFLFFVSASVFFYILCVAEIKKERGDRYPESKKIFSACFLGCFFVFLLSRGLNVKLDFTREKRHTPCSWTKELLDSTVEPFEITYYLSPSLKNLYPQVTEVSDFFDELSSSCKNIRFSIQNPHKNGMESKLSSLGVRPQPVQSSSTSSRTVTDVYSCVALQYLGSTQIIPFVLGTSTLEYDFAVKADALINEKMPAVQVVIANGRSLEQDYSYIKPYIQSMGFKVVETFLPSQSDNVSRFSFNVLNMPAVIVGSSQMTKEDCNALEKWISDGGKAFIASQPYSVDIENDWSVTMNPTYHFKRMLYAFGIYFKESITCDVSSFLLTMKSDTSTEYVNYSMWPVLQSQTGLLNGMTSFWPCSFELDNEVADMIDMETVPVLFTSSASWQTENIDGTIYTNPFACPKTAPEGSEKASYPIGAKVYGKKDKELKVVVLGDQYAFHSSMIAYSSGSGMDLRSLDYLNESLLELWNRKGLLEIKGKTSLNRGLYKIERNSEAFIDAVRKTLLTCLIVPVLAMGLIFVSGKKTYGGKIKN